MNDQRKTKAQLIAEVQQLRQQLATSAPPPAVNPTVMDDRFRILAHATPVLIWMSGTDALCNFFNQPWLTFTGRTLAQELGTGWTEGVHPEDTARCLDTYLTAFHARQPFTITYRLRRADGQFRWLLDNGVPCFLPDGAFAGYIGSCVDVTDQKQLEDELRVSLEKYRVLFESFPLGVTITDGKGNILETNRAAERLLSVPRTVHTQRTVDSPEWQIIRLDRTPMPPAEFASVRALCEQQLIENVELGIVKAPGAITWLNVTAAPLPAPGYGVAVTYGDISDRIRAEEALRLNENTLQALLNAILDSILLIELDGTIILGNGTVAERMGLTVTALPGRNAFELIPPAVAALRRKQVQYVVETGQPVRFEDERFGRWIDNSLYPVCDAQGRPVQVAIFGRDITGRKQAEDGLRDLNVRLEQRVAERTAALETANQQLAAVNERLTELDRLKDEFLSHIGHELRTPLTTVKLYLELLPAVRPDKFDGYLSTLMRETDVLNALIEDLLQVTTLNHDTLEVKLDSVDLNALIAPRLPLWNSMVERQLLALCTDFATNLPPVLVDRALTLQAIAKLITNAINFTPTGSITLSTALRTDDTGSWVAFSVTDTGPGIPAEEMPLLFDRFYRGQATANYKTPGVGVGLYISRQLVEKMGGRLTVASAQGEGATFTMWLPATQTEANLR